MRGRAQPGRGGEAGPHLAPAREARVFAGGTVAAPVESPQEGRGNEGPGLRTRGGLDPTVPIAAFFVLVGWIPPSWMAAVIGFGYFGPLALPAVLAMVGVLAAVIGVMRSLDLQDLRLRRTCLAIGGVGMLRLFLMPLLA